MLRTRTVKMTILPAHFELYFSFIFAVVGEKGHFLLFIWKEVRKFVDIGSNVNRKKCMITVLLSFLFGRHIGTSSAFVKEADRGFQVSSAHNPFEIKKKMIKL